MIFLSATKQPFPFSNTNNGLMSINNFNLLWDFHASFKITRFYTFETAPYF